MVSQGPLVAAVSGSSHTSGYDNIDLEVSRKLRINPHVHAGHLPGKEMCSNMVFSEYAQEMGNI
jgi:hypothetical protein